MVRITDEYKTLNIQPPLKQTSEEPEKDHVISAIQASLQYCFWLGTSETRPVDSSWINSIVSRTCEPFTIEGMKCAKEKIIEKLIQSDITLLDKRIESINEIFMLDFEKYSETWKNPDTALLMLLRLPGFKKDPFKKKALYAIKASNKLTGVESNLDCPADYRIPQVLRHLDILRYDKNLDDKIVWDEFLPENGKYEMAIRKATIEACRLLAEQNNITPHEVDDYLFSLKGECTNKHHLTVTTNY